jgi:hypothetical protein
MISSPRTAQAIPAVIRTRAPKRSIRRPAIGEKKIIGIVTGRISSPLSTAEWPRTSCRYCAWKNITHQ